MGVVREVKRVLLTMAGRPEIASQVYYKMDVDACVNYYRKKAGIPWPLPFIPPKVCDRRRMVMISFDCHGMPIKGDKKYPYYEKISLYFPSVSWAVGKYHIEHRGYQPYAHGDPVFIQEPWDLSRGCCPPDWKNEMLGAYERRG